MNGYKYYPPKTSEDNEKLKLIIKTNKLVLIGERIIRYKIEVENSLDLDWIESYRVLVKVRDTFNITHTLPRNIHKMLIASLFSEIARFINYDDIPYGEKCIITKDVYEYFRPRLEYVSRTECISRIGEFNKRVLQVYGN